MFKLFYGEIRGGRIVAQGGVRKLKGQVKCEKNVNMQNEKVSAKIIEECRIRKIFPFDRVKSFM